VSRRHGLNLANSVSPNKHKGVWNMENEEAAGGELSIIRLSSAQLDEASQACT
jgi:hypothetical protein